MIADLKPYAEYKESRLPWLGQVPGHWDVAPVGRYFRVKSGDMITPKDERDDGVPIYGGNGVRGYTYQSNTTGPVLLLGRVGAKCGCVHFVAQDIWASEHALRVLFKTPSNLRFFAYLLNHADLNRLAIRTAQPLINSTIVRSYRATLPPPDEQAAIVRFLDWANGRLERAIRAKRKVISLLNEQKQAIIHRAVTRGLDPSVPLKPSGIPWLGDIPRHWEVERTKNVFRLRTEKSGLSHGKELLSIYTHIGVRPRKDLEQKGNKASSTDNYWIVRKGDLIVNKLLAWMGAVGMSDYDGVTSPAYDILMPIRPLCSNSAL
jgi:type I restriction enzyme S subunit